MTQGQWFPNGGMHASWGKRAALPRGTRRKTRLFNKEKTCNDVKTGAITNSKLLFLLVNRKKVNMRHKWFSIKCMQHGFGAGWPSCSNWPSY